MSPVLPSQINVPVVSIPNVQYTVPDVQVAATKPKRLDSGNFNQQQNTIAPTLVASQNVSDRQLAHVASGGIGWNNYG